MKKRISLLLALVMVFTMSFGVFAQSSVDAEVKDTAKYLSQKVKEPGFGTMAGEWTVLSIARSGYQVDQSYYDNYYKKVEDVVKSKQGNLSKNKFTEYSRLICALTAIGKDPRNVGGYDLVKPLSNFKNVLKQGINGPIWALIALDTKGYDLSKIENTKDQNSRERMVNEILSREVPGGGWALMGDKADPDITAMALYSLEPYKEQAKVKSAMDRGVQALSDLQLPTGGYETMGDENSESSAQVIIALSTLGINPRSDYRFVKSGKNGKQSVVDALLTFKAPGGGFKHVQTEKEANGMGTDQALEALVALKRFEEKKPALFDMKTDAGVKQASPTKPSPNKGFTDLEGSWAKDLILKTKGFGVANGKTSFQPNKAITRGEFALGIVNGLDLKLGDKKAPNFSDIKGNEWYSKEIAIAAAQGIIQGRGDGNFDPEARLTRQEAMAMLARTLPNEKGNANSLKKFKDLNKLAPWAKDSAALMVDKGLVKGRPEGLAPLESISRAEAVQMIDRLAGVK